MTTEQNPNNPNYDVHSIDFLNNPDLAGLPANFAGMGVIRGSDESADRCTMLVDHDDALMMLEARRDLEEFIALSVTTVRWVRIGWPEEWPEGRTGTLNPAWAPDQAWAPVYPGAAQ